ncbi:MAG: type III pantothenate kinase [Gammaproteobacteria bacterium]|nr:type III pantothenate kinase [Gammaproteobacteria bacterium]
MKSRTDATHGPDPSAPPSSRSAPGSSTAAGVAEVLFLDAGNHRLKWSAGHVSGVVVHAGDWRLSVEQVARKIAAGTVCVCRVKVNLRRTHPFFVDLAQAVEDSFAVGLEDTQPGRLQLATSSLTPAYRHPADLGVDRWCALVAAHHQYPGLNLIVVDAGSAVTVDLVSAHSVHLGGYIIPGLASLAGDCAGLTGMDIPVSIDASRTELTRPGRSSVECVHRGIGRFVCSFLDQICENAGAFFSEEAGASSSVVRPAANHDRECRLLLTGADARWLAVRLGSGSGLVVDNLVLDGLRLIDSISA